MLHCRIVWGRVENFNFYPTFFPLGTFYITPNKLKLLFVLCELNERFICNVLTQNMAVFYSPQYVRLGFAKPQPTRSLGLQ